METADYKRIRELMVETQLIPRGIKDVRVLNAMRKVPRHLFVPEYIRHSAYDDMALPIGEDQTISQPYMVAIMTELLELKGDESVLEIGTGSGYQAAVLAELAGEVYTIERIPELADRAQRKLEEIGYDNVHVVVSDGTKGLEESAPFDRIIITAAAPKLPEPLINQLKEGGIVVAPVGERFSQMLIKGRKEKGVLVEEYHTACVFVPLVGEYGWKG
ncbi:MAG: protein-L-isoaspartate O-methyltransferase [Nitrospirae bacterium GWC2_46_6]|nr:MAG: protein-L-isoaspartate O-methyltransferase [Nitrospirae bacterium GWC2_46_6]OGW20278.1 MAG: protein-L-isoaspartate O-methyltransferase [Nitrospirae bacterium GWA2_46_11]OGW25212.1 MAG: protein-L-isoaspartate O-methyltransferase [Nitrospirae bacterium GWB2_47_37]HAK88013.1 protein-L-isoaspartate O-methyltransferase [Nitrospiraceae bacterium]HCL81173.1 protein-L-isoaspartate O-methyltransferase [Nitrospiraceae bacterium]